MTKGQKIAQGWGSRESAAPHNIRQLGPTFDHSCVCLFTRALSDCMHTFMHTSLQPPLHLFHVELAHHAKKKRPCFEKAAHDKRPEDSSRVGLKGICGPTVPSRASSSGTDLNCFQAQLAPWVKWAGGWVHNILGGHTPAIKLFAWTMPPGKRLQYNVWRGGL